MTKWNETPEEKGELLNSLFSFLESFSISECGTCMCNSHAIICRHVAGTNVAWLVWKWPISGSGTAHSASHFTPLPAELWTRVIQSKHAQHLTTPIRAQEPHCFCHVSISNIPHTHTHTSFSSCDANPRYLLIHFFKCLFFFFFF